MGWYKKKSTANKKTKRTTKQVEKWFKNRSARPTNFIYKSKDTVIYMKSTWEVRYAYWLDDKGFFWYYEPWGINVGCGNYFPDFYLPIQEGIEIDEYHEVKGRLTKIAETKMNNFRQLYPATPLKIIGLKEMYKIPPLSEYEAKFNNEVVIQDDNE